MKAIVILGYGIYQEELAYTRYLDRAFEIVSTENPDVIVLTGGRTNKNFPELSEAASMKTYLGQKDATLDGKMRLEEGSVTTLQNILGAKRILSELPTPPNACIVLCDSMRLPKVFYLTLMNLGEVIGKDLSEEEVYEQLLKYTYSDISLLTDCKMSYEQLSVQGISWDRTREELSHQIMSSIVDIGTNQYPELEKKAIELQKKEI